MSRVDPVELVRTTLLCNPVVPVSGLMVTVLVKGQDAVGVDSVGPPSAGGSLDTASGASRLTLVLRVGLGDGVKSRLLLAGASTAATVVTATRLLVSIDGRLQVRTLACLLAAVALDVGRARLAHRAAVRALRDWATLLIDMLEGTIRMLAVAHAVAAHAGLACILLAVDYHFGGWIAEVDS